MADKKKAPKKTTDKPAEKPPGGRMKLIILIVILLLLLAGGGGAAYYFLWHNKSADEASESEASAETETGETSAHSEEGTGTAPPPEFAPLTYHQLKPKGFRVNLAPGPARFLQVNLTITTPNPAVIAAVDKHMPMLSNDILTVLAAQEYAVLNTPAGKDTLRESLRQTLVRLLARTSEPSDIRDVLFNELIMQ